MIYTTLIEPFELHTFLLNQKVAKQRDLVILDCSCSIADPSIGAKNYALGHIPGALYLDFDKYVTGKISKGSGRHPMPDREAFRKSMEEFGVRPDRQIIVYDQGGLGFATRLWYELRWLGLESVAVLDGGLKAWKQDKYPLSTEASVPLKDGKIHSDLLPLEEPVEMRLIQENQKTKKYLDVDARPNARFHGIGETIDHKAGHIPGAVSRPGSENFDAAGRFKKPTVLREEFLQLLDGRSPDEIIHSCGSGVNATVNLFAMDICGLFGSKLYPGSWSQWIDDESNPIAVD